MATLENDHRLLKSMTPMTKVRLLPQGWVAPRRRRLGHFDNIKFTSGEFIRRIGLEINLISHVICLFAFGGFDYLYK